MRLLISFFILVFSPGVFADSLICKLALKAVLKSVSNQSEKSKGPHQFTLVEQFRWLINKSAEPRTNDFFRPFNRTLKFQGPYLDSNVSLNAPLLVLMEQNPNWSLDPDVLEGLKKRRERFGSKQFSAEWFEEAREISMNRLYDAYAQMGPEIRNNIDTYRDQDAGTFATHLIFALPIKPMSSKESSSLSEFDRHFPPTHEFVGRVQGIGSYSLKHRLNIEKDFDNKVQLNRQEGERFMG